MKKKTLKILGYITAVLSGAAYMFAYFMHKGVTVRG